MSRSLTLKLLVIAAITGVIVVALALVSSTISDRQHYRDDAVKSIEASYAGPQTLVGPVLVRPYTQYTTTVEDDLKGGKKTVEHKDALNAMSFPQVLDVRGQLVPSERHHGLYKVTVYEFGAHLRGSIPVLEPPITGRVEWGEPYLALMVADVRGIVGLPAITVNGEPRTMVQGADAGLTWQPNLRIPLGSKQALGGKVDFAIDMNLAGTEQLSIAPVADSNHVELASSWPSPLFDGQFLPRGTRTVDAHGFAAEWDVSSLATATQVAMAATPARPADLLTVNLLTPIDPYKLSDRATKYGILFVVLTFGGFFLFEMLKHLQIHPVQYLLVGFGLAIFFLLLISFSEHMAFGLAYLIASAACIGLLTFYLYYVLHSLVFGLGFGAMLVALYGAVYGLLLSEDNALLLGSLLLFVVLAGVMAVTRKVDWYRTNTALAPPPPPASSATIEG
jgi:inner membrane protein